MHKCTDHCNTCPDGGSILQFGTGTCLQTCPVGFYVSPDGTQCLKCTSPCIDCEGSATNCTQCGVISNVKYFLNDTDLNNVAIGGVCVTNCTGAFYEGLTTLTCLPCQAGCAECDVSPTNCSSCKNTDATNYFFLQPGANTCSSTCPSEYFKQTDFKCEKCALGYGDWNPIPATPISPCSELCNDACATCFGSAVTQCYSCKGTNYLQPGSTTCTNSCPPGYNPSTSGNLCELTQFCHSSCGGCSVKADKTKCTSCASGFTPVLTFEAVSVSTPGACNPAIKDSNYPNIKQFSSIDKDTVMG